MSRRVLLEIRDGVATVTLNHPDKLNAIDEEMRDALPSVVERLGEPDVRVATLPRTGDPAPWLAGLLR